jgi:hypothetical protein
MSHPGKHYDQSGIDENFLAGFPPIDPSRPGDAGDGDGTSTVPIRLHDRVSWFRAGAGDRPLNGR